MIKSWIQAYITKLFKGKCKHPKQYQEYLPPHPHLKYNKRCKICKVKYISKDVMKYVKKG